LIKQLFNNFFKILEVIINKYVDSVDVNYGKEILEAMGFPKNWKEVNNYQMN